MDQWQLEELAKVVATLQGEGGHATACPPRRCGSCHVEPAASVEQAVADCLAEYGPTAQRRGHPEGAVRAAVRGVS